MTWSASNSGIILDYERTSMLISCLIFLSCLSLSPMAHTMNNVHTYAENDGNALFESSQSPVLRIDSYDARGKLVSLYNKDWEELLYIADWMKKIELKKEIFLETYQKLLDERFYFLLFKQSE